MKLLKTLLPILLILLISCDESEINFSEEKVTIVTPSNVDLSSNFGLEISRNFLGRVIDLNENPIPNTTINIGNKTATTDVNGIFMINDATVFEHFAYITATKSGYIHGSRTLIPTNGTNKLTIMLLDETTTGTTSSGNTDTISLADGSSVTLNGNFVTANGTAYNGSVSVVLHHLDPADPNMTMQMPGMLYAGNLNNQERMLQSFGMLAVELRGANNEDLNLANGSTAEIRIPLDVTLQADAPNTIKLWYFDEIKGYWIEDGSATLVDNVYIGTVTHFSFWNTDADFPTVELCINVTDEVGNALANQFITLTNYALTYPTTSGYTDGNGQVCGLIPSNETLELNALNYSCGISSIFNLTLNPYTSDAVVDITIPSSPSIITETVTGVFKDCNDNVVANGYILLRYENQTFFDSVDNGNFEISLLRCTDENTFTVEGIDFDNIQTTGEISYTFNTPTTNLGTINSCNDINEFIQYTLDGVDEIFIDNITTSFDNTTNPPSLGIFSNSQNNCFYLFGKLNDSPYVGAYSYPVDTNNNGDIYDDIGIYLTECIGMSGTNNVVFNLTTFGDVGEYIDINFSGDYEDYNGNAHTITGVIHVIRD